MRLLAFDYGLRHIGIASGQTVTATATPRSPISSGKKSEHDWDKLVECVREWQPNLLVVGLPLLMDGSENDMSNAARKFAIKLAKKCGLPYVLVDERLSSFSAKREVRDVAAKTPSANRRLKQTSSTHSLAACAILDTWFSLSQQERAALLKQNQAHD